MSMSKIPSLCVFCNEGKALYKCPKCNVKYCSSKCFNHRSHNDCSELFYQKWVMSTLQNQKTDKPGAKKMMEILKKVAAEDNDVDEENEPSLEARFSDIDLSKDVEESKVWERLTEEEQDTFKKMLNDEKVSEIIPVVQPWWIAEKVTFVENSNDELDNETQLIAKRPPLPIGIKTLTALTTKPPSDSVQYNILNVLYCYACLTRLYNNDLTDFIEDVIDAVFFLSPIFSENKNYFSLDEVVQDSLRLITSSQYKLDINFAKSLSYDVCCIIQGPGNTRPHSYVICALSDLKTLMLNFKAVSKESDSWKSAKKLLLPAVRKLDYFLSWSIDYYEKKLKLLLDEIKLKYLPEIISDSFVESEAKSKAFVTKQKQANATVLIEELN